jgi:hypothetical protein
MSKIYVICTKHDENLLSLHQEASYLNHQVIPVYTTEYNEKLVDTLRKNITLEDYVMILHVNFGTPVIPNLINSFECKRFLNRNSFINYPYLGDKWFQQYQVSTVDNSIVIPTFYKDNVDLSYSDVWIAKPSTGSCGNGIGIIKSEDIKPHYDYIPQTYLLQPYIKNDGDWRVVVVGGKCISAIKRLRNPNHITNNIATGSFAIKEENSLVLEQIYSVAEKASVVMEFDYVGIDVIKDLTTNKYYFLESNERPTFETSQILTGINISRQIITELTK